MNRHWPALVVVSLALVFRGCTARAQSDFFSGVVKGFETVPGFDALRQSLGIFPGTKWCGAGDRAASYEDLGTFNDTDSCCRDHDHCPDYIAAGDTEHGLTNSGRYTRSHCDCDAQFHGCLRNASSAVSNNVGVAYFNVLGPQCFRLERPAIQCAENSGIPLYRCTRYETDMGAELEWQWFDNLMYDSAAPN